MKSLSFLLLLCVLLSTSLTGCASSHTIPSPLPQPPQGEQYSFSAAGGDANDLWIVGELTHNFHCLAPFALHWNSSSWQLHVFQPSFGNPLFVSVTNPYSVWLAGTSQSITPALAPQHAIVMHFDGHTWQNDSPTQAEYLSPEFQMESFSVGSDNAAWLAFTTGDVPHILHWSGSSWISFSLNRIGPKGSPVLNVNSVVAQGSKYAWIAGEIRNGSAISFLVHINGTRVTRLPMPTAAHNSSIHSIQVLSPNDIWIVGYGSGNAFCSEPLGLFHWNGSSWTSFERHGTAYPGTFDSISFPSSHFGWAVAEEGGFGISDRLFQWTGTRFIPEYLNVDPSAHPAPAAFQAHVLYSPTSSFAVLAGSWSSSPDSNFTSTPFIAVWNGGKWTALQ